MRNPLQLLHWLASFVCTFPPPSMASSAKAVSRLSSIALKFRSQKTSLNSSPLKSASKSAINSRVSLISRLPVELSSLETMMPLHSAIASARLQSSLSLDSQRWGLVPQGISMPL